MEKVVVKVVAGLYVKGAFDHLSKTKLVKRMMELVIDVDLIRWKRFFLTDRRIQLVIDEHTNRKQDIKTGISQESPVLFILFLVYISGVFEKESISYPGISALFFIDNLGFIASGYSVKEFAKTLGQVATVVLDWRKFNAVTYDIAKTEAVFFSKFYRQQLNK